MEKIKAIKVATPGSAPILRTPKAAKRAKASKKSPGRPKRLQTSTGTIGKQKNYKNRYDEEAMASAIQAVKDGEMGVRAAAKHFNVPRSTLSDRYNRCANTDTGTGTFKFLNIFSPPLINS